MTWKGKQPTDEEYKRQIADLLIHEWPWKWDAMFTGESALYLGRYGEWKISLNVNRMRKDTEGISGSLLHGPDDSPMTMYQYSDDAARSAYRKAIYYMEKHKSTNTNGKKNGVENGPTGMG